MRTINIPLWTWLETHGKRRLPSVPASSDHRWLWGWMRLALGLTQMCFAVVAAYLLAADGPHWRAVVAASVATVAAVASRYLFAGRPDPRLEASLNGETSTRWNGAEGEARSKHQGT
jgi:hypothetical protein